MIQLSDDGTLDTVLICSKCRTEFRYNFQSFADGGEEDYEEFVQWAIDDAKGEHVGLFGRCIKDEYITL